MPPEITELGAPPDSGANRAFGQSPLVLGTAQLGGAYGIANATGAPDDEATAALLRTAVDLGVTHLDTARAYGDSERRIGCALRRLDPVPLRFVTKVAPLGPAVADGPDGVRAAVSRSVAESLTALAGGDPDRPSRPDAPARGLSVLLHRAADAAVAGGAAWQRLRDLRAEGVAERIGISVQSPAELLAVVDLPDLGYVQLPCNVLDRRWLSADVSRALAERPGLVVTVRSVYLQGLLAAGRELRWPHLPDPVRDTVLSTLDVLAGELGRRDRRDLCVAYVRGLPWVTSVVIGAETVEQLRGNALLAAQPPLTGDERARVLAALPPMPGELLDPSRWGR